MSAPLSPVRIGDDVYEIAADTPHQAQQIARAIRSAKVAEEVVAGLSSVCVKFAPNLQKRCTELINLVDSLRVEAISAPPLISLEIHYGGEDGPDFAKVCDALDLSPERFIALHTAQVHTVEMIGFTPGFSYISGLPQDVEVPRLSDPRPRVQAGSVGISAAFTGIYALAGPGGWPLIGRTSQALFDPASESPFLLQPGQRLKFKAI